MEIPLNPLSVSVFFFVVFFFTSRLFSKIFVKLQTTISQEVDWILTSCVEELALLSTWNALVQIAVVD